MFCTALQIVPNFPTIILRKCSGWSSEAEHESQSRTQLYCYFFPPSNCMQKFFLPTSSTMFQYPVIYLSRLVKSSQATGCSLKWTGNVAYLQHLNKSKLSWFESSLKFSITAQKSRNRISKDLNFRAPPGPPRYFFAQHSFVQIRIRPRVSPTWKITFSAPKMSLSCSLLNMEGNWDLSLCKRNKGPGLGKVLWKKYFANTLSVGIV